MKNLFRLSGPSILINRYILLSGFLLLIYLGSWYHWLVVLGVYTAKGLMGTAVIHRGLSHRAFKMNKIVERVLAGISLLGTNATVITWVAVHRQHHRFSDQPGDLHSPQLYPYWDVQIMKFHEPPNLGYAADLVKQRYYIWLYKWHWAISFSIALVLLLIDPMVLLCGWLAPNFIQSYAGTTVNALNHINFGYRNFDTKDNSHNNFVTGILCLGEGWHNNHHQDPANPNFGVKWWEFDIGYQFTKLIQQKTA